MTCETFTTADGGMAYRCRAGRQGIPRCSAHGCDKRGLYLCDFVTGPGDASCDAPFCNQHREAVGEEMDYCPGHARQHELELND